MTTKTDLLTVSEVAEIFRCSRATVYSRVQSGDLPIVRVLGKTLFDRAEIDLLIEQSRKPVRVKQPVLRVELGRKVRGVRRYAD